MSVESKGHSGFENSGKDIVCAGISVLLQNAVLSIGQLLKIELNVYVNEKDGILKFNLPDNLSENQMHDAQIILKSMLLGVKDIENSYKKFVSVKEN